MMRALVCFAVVLSVPLPGIFAQSNSGQAPPADYRLQVGDGFEVLYRYTPEYNQTVTVQPDGQVALTLLGAVPVRGLTIEEARDRITREAAKRLSHPEVSLSLKDFVKPHFTVLGEVASPGRFELHGDLAAADAIAMAGGLKESARHTQILLIHRVNNTVGETQLLDFKALEKAHPGQELLTLRDGDLIIVPQNKISKVERFVKLANIGVYYPL
jgi:polysaccharide export outer membrane protein